MFDQFFLIPTDNNKIKITIEGGVAASKGNLLYANLIGDMSVSWVIEEIPQAGKNVYTYVLYLFIMSTHGVMLIASAELLTAKGKDGSCHRTQMSQKLRYA